MAMRWCDGWVIGGLLVCNEGGVLVLVADDKCSTTTFVCQEMVTHTCASAIN